MSYPYKHNFWAEIFRPNSRMHYWSCSKFANWIRGESKPWALEWGEWDNWHDEQKKKRPWRYWLAEDVLSKLQKLIYFPSDVYNNIRYYISNRWFDKTHYLQTGFQPGFYHEVDERILYALFNTLVIFLEDELAYRAKWLENTPKKYLFKNGRCKEALYDYWAWEQNLVNEEDGTPTSQAITSKEIQALYEWWTVTRPNRPDPYTNITEEELANSLDFKNRTDEDRQKSLQRYEIEELYDQEDTDMLIRLIKIRGSLWT